MATVVANTPGVAIRSNYVVHLSVLDKGETLTVAARKLHIVLARLAGEQYRRLSEPQRGEIEGALRSYIEDFRAGKVPDKPVVLLQPRFFADMRELAKMVGFEPKNARHLAEHFKRLENCTVRFNSLRHSVKAEELYPDEVEVTAKLLSSVLRNGRGQVSWAYDPVILGVMVRPLTFTQLSLELVKNARTYTALALYENCRRFAGVHHTGAYPVRKWQELLSPDGVVPAWETPAEFMRKVKAAIRELDACEGCDILITPVKVPVANLGNCLRFEVHTREQSRLPFGMPVPSNRELLRRLTDIGFSEYEGSAYIEDKGEEYLIMKFLLLDKAKDVRDPRAWLRAAIEEDFVNAAVAAEAERHKAKLRAETARQAETVKAAFATHLADRLRQRFSEQPEDVRAGWEVGYAEQEPEANSKLRGTAKEAAFFGWLAKQPHDLYRDEDEDFASFAVGYLGAVDRATKAAKPGRAAKAASAIEAGGAPG